MSDAARPITQLFLLLVLGLNFVSAQHILDYKIKVYGSFPLQEVLNFLHNEVPIAYSPDKLPNQLITIHQNSTIEELFDKLQEIKLLEYKVEDSQIIVTPYLYKNYTINGVLKDVETGEHLIGAAIQVVGSTLGALTNGYGYYSITLSEGDYKLRFSHIGYSSQIDEVSLNSNVYMRVSMTPLPTALEEVEVNAFANNVNILGNVPSINRLFITEADGQIPYFLGEVDVIQNVLMQPGIRSVGEDASGIHVRGGGVDQNLTLLDEATIYNPNHFYGLISVFNPEAVNDIKILKGYIPPSYGGRGSSVIAVRQKEGNANKLSYSGGIGVLSARGLIEGPLKKGKSSLLLSGRQSLLNLSIDDFASTSVRRNRIRFQDVNMKINSRPNSSNTLYLSAYYGNDRNAVGLNSVRKWGNRMLNFRWNHLFTPQIFSNTSAFISVYNYRIENERNPGAFVGKSKIIDYSLKWNVTYSFNPTNDISFGFNTILHTLSPGSREPFQPNSTTNRIELNKEQGLESAVYLGHDINVGKVGMNYGIRYSMLHNLGSGKVFIYQNDQPTSDTAIVDTTFFKSGELISFFQNLEPRFALNWILNEKTSLKASYSQTAQYIHLISNTVSPAPTDIWMLTNDYIPPLTTGQYILGLYKNIKDNKWELSLEGYFKRIKNNIQYKSGANLVFNENIETELLLSRARAYGLEFSLRKQKGKVKGWISYSLSRAESKLNENQEERFVLENHDKAHDFSTSWNMNLSPRLSASANFIFNTGIPVTLPTDKYIFEGNLVPHFADRNNARLPNYHRLDISLRLDGRERKKRDGDRKNRDYWIMTIYNVYARKNAYSYFYRESEINSGLGEVVQYSIFGTILPAITYNFKF